MKKPERINFRDKMLEHLQTRYMNLNRHVIWIADDEYCATFPLWNLSGSMVGYQSYRPNNDKVKMNHPKDGRYFTYRKKECWVPWGLESYYWNDGPIFVSEGIFDACRFTNHGKTGLAVMTNKPPIDFLNFLSFLTRPIVVIADNDVAGNKLKKYGEYVEVVPHPFKDLGDSSEEYVTWLIKKYS